MSKKDWKLVNFCEFDPYAIKSYCAIHKVDERLNLGDITLVDENGLEAFNMICGGSPCQDNTEEIVIPKSDAEAA